MKRSWVVSLVVALALLGGACNEGDDEGGSFELELSGAAEVCDEGGKCGGDGSGTATVDINSDQNEICYEITLEGVEGANASHIHEAEEGESGDVVVDLAYTGEEGERCVD
ncbi:MAG: CHRD domain-containing protein, partial [Actinomycetota bacterium]|nr:CHRD domain-containing protein [Actinomycetota bacterium]